ncbi:MAG: DUF2917 domain-containing protein [Burkholderiales bacterium]|nr:DUF2917 domain-containing protein [Burkholderiales bacterium]
MKLELDHPSTLLRRGTLLRVAAVRGGSLGCRRGMVWITQENDPHDRILAAGESFVLDRPGMALINALGADAVIACERGLVCEQSPLPVDPSRARTRSLAGEIDRIGPRREPAALFPPQVRQLLVEREARWMRARVAWLVLQHAKRAAAALVERVLGAFGALPEALRRLRRKPRAAAH